MQTRLRDFKEPILSFDHNIANLGIHSAGRYCGFDTLTPTGPLAFKLQHTQTGIRYKNPINTTLGPSGVVITPQGVIIAEDADIQGFNVASNAGNAEIRYDLIIMTHSQVNVAGGQAATYSILQGPSGNPIKPILTDPFHQTAIGVVAMQPNSNDVAFAEYTRFKSPDSGDGEDARLAEPNVFKAIQIQSASNQIYTTPSISHVNGLVTEHLFDFNNDGNVFKLLPLAVSPILFSGFKIKDTIIQEGARISIIANEHVSLAQSIFWVPTYANKGYQPLFINAGLANSQMTTSSGNVVVRPNVGEQWELEFVFLNSSWFLSKIGGAGNNSAFRRGMIIEYFGNLNLNFDGTGLGINLMAGWHILNGNNNVPDRRGRLPIMASLGIPSAGAPDLTLLPSDSLMFINPNTNAGTREKLITQSHIPSYALSVNDPGHQHSYIRPRQDGSATGNATSHPDGPLQSYLTSMANTGITVNSGGGGVAFDIMPPVQSTIYIIKL